MANKGIWLTDSELAALPTSGTAFNSCKSAADAAPTTITSIRGNNYDDDVRTLACALMARKLGGTYINKCGNLLYSAIDKDNISTGDQDGGLGIIRNTNCLVLAADIMDMASWDSTKEAAFKAWITALLHRPISGNHSSSDGIVFFSEERPNNYFGMAMSSRVAIHLYNNDSAGVARCAQVMQGWLGNRAQYASFSYGDLAWQCNPSLPVGINPSPCVKSGFDIGGALPDDMRRGGGFQIPATYDGHIWGCMTNFLPALIMLKRAGYPSYTWSNSAADRAADCLWRMGHAGWSGWPAWATGDDETTPWLINYIYGANGIHGSLYPASSPTSIGKNIGWTDYTHASAAPPPTGDQSKSGSETFYLTEARSISVTRPASDSITFTDIRSLDTSGGDASYPVTQSISLTESRALSITSSLTDSGSLTEGASRIASTASDSIALTETRSIAATLSATDTTPHLIELGSLGKTGTDSFSLSTQQADLFQSVTTFPGTNDSFGLTSETATVISIAPTLVDLRMTGEDVSSYERPIRIRGFDTDSVEVDLTLIAQGEPVDAMANLHIFGSIPSSTESSLRIYGTGGAAVVTVFMLEIPLNPSTSSLSVEDSFAETDSSIISAALELSDTGTFEDSSVRSVTSDVDLRITGFSSSFGDRDMRIVGTIAITVTQDRGLRISGQQLTSTDVGTRIWGSALQNFDSGVTGTDITIANTGDAPNVAFDNIGGTGTHVFDDSQIGSGTLSSLLYTRAVSTSSYFEWDSVFGDNPTEHYGRLYYRITTNPSVANPFVQMMSSSTTLCSIRAATNGTIQLVDSTGTVRATSTTTILPNRWYRIEWKIIQSVSSGQIVCRIYSSANGMSLTEEFSTANTISTGIGATRMRIGMTASTANWPSATGSFWVDEIIAGANTWPGSAVPGFESNSTTTLRLFGVNPASELRGLHITGKDVSNTEADFKLFGEGTSDTSATALHITGASTSSIDRNLKVSGKAPSSEERALKMSASGPSSASVTFKFVGSLDSNTPRDLRIQGAQLLASSTERGLRITAPTLPSSTTRRDMRISGKNTKSMTRTICIRGKGWRRGWGWPRRNRGDDMPDRGFVSR